MSNDDDDEDEDEEEEEDDDCPGKVEKRTLGGGTSSVMRTSDSGVSESDTFLHRSSRSISLRFLAAIFSSSAEAVLFCFSSIAAACSAGGGNSGASTTCIQ